MCALRSFNDGDDLTTAPVISKGRLSDIKKDSSALQYKDKV